ncbi:hypothetical protein [Mumia sp. ZJ1417]|uniref:hypothetical protein n=1 Tax=Mumia sp. ZJ1417 TaxID=2708082 RepID=UPI001AB02282|nr:hypothetical protein [Mumia sp. ZJ1417]
MLRFVEAAGFDGAPRCLGTDHAGRQVLSYVPGEVASRTSREAHALIDFDMARPATRKEEVQNLLLWCAPPMAPRDRPEAMAGVDPYARARLLVDAYGLGSDARSEVVAVAENTAARAWFLMRDRAARLGGGWARMWAEVWGTRSVAAGSGSPSTAPR